MSSFVDRLIVAGVLLVLLPSSGFAAQIQLDALRMHDAPEYTRVVLDISAPVRFELFTLENPHRVVVDLANTRAGVAFDPDAAADARARVKKVRASPRGDGVRVVLDTSRSVDPKGFVLDPVAPYGYRLVIDLHGAGDRVRKPRIVEKPAGRRDIIVAIDPGHGGEDPGAIGPGGLMEKNVVMQISRRLEKKLAAAEGYQPVLIRNGDYGMRLGERKQVAREVRADLFVSIHADAFKTPSASGASVYTLSDRGASSETARWLAAEHDNSDLIGGEEEIHLDDKDGDLAKVLVGLSMDATRSASISLGSEILANLSSFTKLHKKRVEQAGFMVLKSPDIPSVLVETGFISNPGEARRLGSGDYQNRMAAAIAAGIRNYMARHAPEGTLVAWQREQGGQRYTVSRGDTLSGIAVRYGTSTRRIKEANGLRGDSIRVGQVITIPAG